MGQALLGSDRPVLDFSLLPEGLRQAVEKIAAQGLDAPTTLLQQLSLILSSDSSNQSLNLNSISLSKMEQYQNLLEHLKEQGVTSTKQKAQLKKVHLSTQEQTLLQDVRAHQGPVPLLEGDPISIPTFPHPINDLIKLASKTDPTGLLLFWLLRKLSEFNMAFKAEDIIPLIDEYLNPENGGICFKGVLVSRYMLQELLIKVGGASLRYILPLITQNKTAALLCERMENLAAQNNLVYLKQGAGAVKGLYPEFDLDYATLFKKAALEDAIGLFIKLRWTNPALSREILPAKLQRCTLENRAYYLRQLWSNLSLNDEELLMQELKVQASPSCKEIVSNQLASMGSTQYSKLCLELCSKYLSFDGKRWNLQELYYSAESEALGIIKTSCSWSAIKHHRFLLKNLLYSLTWADLCSLAQASTDQEAFEHWLEFDKSEHIPEAQDFYVMLILGESISKTGSEQTREAFINFVFYELPSLVDAEYLAEVRQFICLNFLMHFDLEKRKLFLPFYTDMPNVPSSWFVEPGSSLFDLKTLDSKWSLAVLQHVFDLTKGRLYDSEIALLGMYLSLDMVSFCKEQRPKIQNLLAENKEMPEKTSTQSVLYNVRKMSAEYTGKLNMLDRLQAYLQAKQRMEQVISQELGAKAH